MKYEEFKKFTVGLFSDFTSVEEAKNIGIIPSEYKDSIPNQCECGSDRIISKNKTMIRCCNPRCYIKQGYCLEKFLKKFGAKDIGAKTCSAAIRQLQISKGPNFAYTDIVRLNYAEFPYALQGTYGVSILQAINGMLSVKVGFPELITSLGIPSLDAGSKHIFKGMENIQDFLTAVDKSGGVKSFFYQRGVEDKSKIYNTAAYMRDIINICVYMSNNIRKAPMMTVEIVLTGRIVFEGMSITKDEYIRMLNDNSIAENGVQLFEFNSCKARETASYIVATSDNGSASYMAGVRRKRNGETKVLQTPDSLAQLVKKEVEDYNERWR